jgi:hypothetical protein
MILYDEVIFRGRYVFDISPYTRITIKDLKNDKKFRFDLAQRMVWPLSEEIANPTEA